MRNDPEAVAEILNLPYRAYVVFGLCLGYPAEEHLDPELERAGWQRRSGLDVRWLHR